MSVDIFIKTYHEHFSHLEWCLKSIKKFASGFRNVIIVSDADGRIFPLSLIEILPVKVIYKFFPEKWPENSVHTPGYLWQQIVKLKWTEYTDADAVVILDSDEMISRPITPDTFRDGYGRWRWSFRDWKEAGDADVWKKPTEEVLKFEPKYEAMVCSPFVLERKTTINFIEYLKNIHRASDLYDVFFKYDMTRFSEYNAYGSYVYKFDNQTTYYFNEVSKGGKFIRVLVKSLCYDELTEPDIKMRELLLD
jgi:hypothetical protein